MTPVAIFTSLPPRLVRIVDGVDVGDAYQQRCVASWMATSCPVYSVNAPAEIAQIGERFPGVKFLATAAGADSPLPTIAELIGHMGGVGAGVSLYVNADIRLSPGVPIVDIAARFAADAMLLGNRTNIQSPDDVAGNGKSGSFDLIAIGRSVLGAVPVNGYRLGEPWWDYWLPTGALLSGLVVRLHAGTVGLHLNHPKSWDGNRLVAHGRRFVAMFEKLVAGRDISIMAPAERALTVGINDALSRAEPTADEAARFILIAQRVGRLLNAEQIVPAVALGCGRQSP